MKEKINIIHANIDNLTSLWQTASEPFQSYFPDSGFNHCYIKNSDWPNRLWLNQDLDREIIPLVKEKIVATPSPLIISYWDIYGIRSDRILESEGFIKKFEQIGMSLKLDKPIKIENHLNIRLVSNKFEAKLWSKLFEMSFGYKISKETVLKTNKEIDYYIAYSQNNAVGTAISYKTNNVVGIHSVGIPPEMRRKGFAGQIMKLLINSAIENGIGYMTLQASNMGKHLYLKLGFEEDFIIKNYQLQQL